MIKLDLINEVVTKTGVTKTTAEMAVETVFESMKKSLARGDRIELRGFGVFTVRPRENGIGRNPRTGCSRGQHSARQGRPLQAWEGIAIDRVVGASMPCFITVAAGSPDRRPGHLRSLPRLFAHFINN